MAKARKAPAKQGQQSASLFSSLSPTKLDMLCVGFLYLTTLVLFRGIVFDNAAFAEAGDTATALSYVHVGEQINEAEGVDVLWMPNFFSGMPTFGNVAYVPHNVNYLGTAMVKILNLLYLNAKWGWIIVHYLIGGVFMFLLMRIWKFSRPVALFVALTFMLTPNAIGLAGEGHGSKLMALMYLPAVFLLTHQLFEQRNLLTFGLLSAAIGTLLLTNHMQIVYYILIVVGSYSLYNIALEFMKNKLLAAKSVALLVGALTIGLSISSYIYLAVYEYSTFSIRGGGTAGSTGGLSFDYATNWSWNPWETIIYLIPSFFGFSSPLYWGEMPFHTSTEYIGIIPILLAVIALVYKRNKVTMFFAALTFVVFLVSLGKYFPSFYNLLFHYLPLFNKFRIPSMILHLMPFTVGILAAYGMSFLLESRDEAIMKKLKTRLIYVTGALGALLIIGVLFKSSVFETLSGSMLTRESDMPELQQQYGQQAGQVFQQYKQLRFDLLWKDFVKFVLIFAASAATIIGFLNKKIHAGAFGAALIAILIVDLVIVDVKFINPKPAQRLEENFQPDATIAYLKKQPGLFRIAPLPVGGQLFMDNTFAYHGIHSIGGYSPAKLKIYQTLLDSCIGHGADPNFPLNMNILNMLNARYIIVPGQLPEGRFTLANVDQAKRYVTYLNPFALPRAFFVKEVTVARNQTEVFAALNSIQFNAATRAIVEKPMPQDLSSPDSTSAEILEYKSREISIKAFTSSPALLVLSEVYYPAGWKAFVDDNETEIFKTNYILRSIIVPKGEHTVSFKFDPPLYTIGWNLSRAGWGVSFFFIFVGLWKTPAIRARFRGRKPEQAAGSRG
jgi:hypothetical protein